MGSKEDINKYPLYIFVGFGKIVKLEAIPTHWNIWYWQCHHYIEQSWIKRNPDKFKKIEHLQKLFFLPVKYYDKGIEHNMHSELHARHSKFKERYGIDISELLYNTNK